MTFSGRLLVTPQEDHLLFRSVDDVSGDISGKVITWDHVAVETRGVIA